MKALDINNIRIKNIVNKIIHKNKQKEISLIKSGKNMEAPPDAPSSLSSSSSSSSTSSTSTTGAAEVALRDLCEMHGHKIYVFLPQVFQREEMRLERDCKVHPHSGARSAVQIQCPHGHDCRYVKMSAAGASRLVNNPIVVCGQEGPRYLISHQYECQQCLTSTFIFS